MQIFLNEKSINLPAPTSLYSLRDQFYPQADVLIVNGYPASNDQDLYDGDTIVMIQRGKQPSPQELVDLMTALTHQASRKILVKPELESPVRED